MHRVFLPHSALGCSVDIQAVYGGQRRMLESQTCKDYPAKSVLEAIAIQAGVSGVFDILQTLQRLWRHIFDFRKAR